MQRSRGKGNRRLPGRDGGARHQRTPDWRSRAQHLAENSEELGSDLVEIDLWSRESPEKCIYRFDQAAAAGGLWYLANLEFSGFRNTRFRVHVEREQEQAALRAAESAKRL